MSTINSLSTPIGKSARVFAVTSGKGGVGKTIVTANLAAVLAKRGQKVLVIDADLGLANLDVVLNIAPTVTIHDVFNGKAALKDAVIKAPGGFSVLMAGSGLIEYSRLSLDLRDNFTRILAELMPRYDIILLDTGAGISDVVLFSISLASEVIVVATPEPTSLTDAYAMIKVLVSIQQRQTIHMVINQISRLGEGRDITNQLHKVLSRFVKVELGMHTKLNHLVDIPYDDSVRYAGLRRQLFTQLAPGGPAGLGMNQLASKLETMISPTAT